MHLTSRELVVVLHQHLVSPSLEKLHQHYLSKVLQVCLSELLIFVWLLVAQFQRGISPTRLKNFYLILKVSTALVPW